MQSNNNYNQPPQPYQQYNQNFGNNQQYGMQDPYQQNQNQNYNYNQNYNNNNFGAPNNPYDQNNFQQQQQPQVNYAKGQPQQYQQEQQIDVVVIGRDNPGPQGMQYGGGDGRNHRVPMSAQGLAHPVDIQCGSCGRTGQTKVTSKVGSNTICCSVLIFCIFWPLFWIPCVMSECKDKEHRCRYCDFPVGTKEYEIC